MQAPPAPKTTTTINAPLLTSRLLQGRYRLIAQIGEGGFGAVYQAEDTRLGNRLVAIKEMKPSGLKPQELHEATEAFHREAMLLTDLKHPSLPAIHDQFTEDGQYYLVMEFIQGRTLESSLAKAPKGRLPVRDAFQIALQLCNVLDYLHSQHPPIIFRDLKPSNIMLTPEGQVYLIDFGIARHFKPGQSKDTTAFGTTGYASPEQYGKAQTTPRSDVYSLGAVMHHMLTGDDPANTPFRFAPLLMPRPTGTWTYLRTMLEIEEHKRPADMRVVRQNFQRLADAWEYERQHGRAATAALPQVQAATGFLPAVRPGQATQAPLLANASTQAPPQIYPAQASPGKAPKGARIFQPVFIIAVVLVVGIVMALIAAIASNNNVNQPQPNNGTGSQNSDTPFTPPTATQTGAGPAVFSAALSADGTLVAFSDGSLVEIWNSLNNAIMQTYKGHSAPVLSVAWAPRGDLVASAGADGTVQIWNWHTDQTTFTYGGHTDQVRAVAWSPDETRLAAASDDKTVQVWDALTGTNEHTLISDQSALWSVAWSPDGRLLAAGSARGKVQVWDSSNYSVVNTFYRGGGVTSLAWSPTSRQLAAASADHTVQVWSLDQGKVLVTYQAHKGAVEAVAWSPDGQYLASGSQDNTVQVWFAANGAPAYIYTGHAATVLSVSWSLDSSRIASGDSNGTVQVWNAIDGGGVQVLSVSP